MTHCLCCLIVIIWSAEGRSPGAKSDIILPLLKGKIFSLLNSHSFSSKPECADSAMFYICICQLIKAILSRYHNCISKNELSTKFKITADNRKSKWYTLLICHNVPKIFVTRHIVPLTKNLFFQCQLNQIDGLL